MRALSVGKLTLAALAVLALCLVSAPSALAGSCAGFDLTSNNLGISGSVGCVTVADTGTNQVTITITMNPGFSIKLAGGDVAISGNFPTALVLGDASGLNADGHTGMTFKQFRSPQNISQFGTFTADYANIHGLGSIVSANVFTFVLTSPGLDADDFTRFGIHFCTASGSNCGPQTGFASSTSTVPEPGTLTLLGTGFLGLAALIRRRFSGV